MNNKKELEPIDHQESIAEKKADKDEADKKPSDHSGPVGLDIGTANIVVASNGGRQIENQIQLNAFFTIPHSRITGKTLTRDKTMFFEKNDKFYIMGDAAENFANIFDGDTRRPIENGIINPNEEEGISVVQSIVDKLVQKPRKEKEKICFSVPGEPFDNPIPTIYHEEMIKRQLANLGYTPVPINEGLAVVLSELSASNFTGIGISMGGGMCNVCFSYLSVPVMTYSMQKGGDYIDMMVGQSVGETPTKIKRIKENDLDLSSEPKTRIENGLHIYYEHLFSMLAQSLQQVLGSAENIPRLSKAVPIALSGGTVIPRGSKEKFKKALDDVRLPIKISEIVIPEKPLYATANGALQMVMNEDYEI